MSIMSTPLVADLTARAMDLLAIPRTPKAVRFTEIPGRTQPLSIPTRHGAMDATLYLPPDGSTTATGVYVNSHGGGFVIRHAEMDDPWCRYLAANAGVAVLNVDYAVAPIKRFPTPVEQVYDAIVWAAKEPDRWDGSKLAIGGQSAGGTISAAVSRLALETSGSPQIALQVLHYPALELVTRLRDRPSTIKHPMLKPWMGEVFNTAYTPDPASRRDRLASPGWGDNAEGINGIAPAVVITCEYDRLHEEGTRYAHSLQKVGALREHIDVEGVDHGYNLLGKTRQPTGDVYRRITQHLLDTFAAL